MAFKDIQNLSVLFSPAVARNPSTRQVESYVKLTLSDVGGVSVAASSSFKQDPPGAPLKSTQQIPLDFSKFENHTFFNSAESNVNIAFERIINRYPFDGTQTEKDGFLEGLTGFEKYVYDQFPKYKNFARFDASANNYITVKDFAGTDYPTLSRDKTGQGILDPGQKSIAFEMQFFPPSGATDSAIILQKLSGFKWYVFGRLTVFSWCYDTECSILCFIRVYRLKRFHERHEREIQSYRRRF